jgi:catechol 2,3-dioxygenase-like lactoylglutathione lyase family enzyme
MTTTAMKPRVTSFALQFLVDDLERSIAYYEKLGFTFGEPWDGFYAIGHLDGRLTFHSDAASRRGLIQAFHSDRIIRGHMLQEEILERLSRLETSCLCDAKKTLRVFDSGIQPLCHGVIDEHLSLVATGKESKLRFL